MAGRRDSAPYVSTGNCSLTLIPGGAKELVLQGHVVSAVKWAGGFAFKCNHRFSIGVADLFIKLPKYPASFFECKVLRSESRDHIMMSEKANWIRLKCITAMQANWLTEYIRCGGWGGYMSFLTFPDQHDWGMRAFAYNPEWLVMKGSLTKMSEHFMIPYKKKDRYPMIIRALEQAYKDQKDGICPRFATSERVKSWKLLKPVEGGSGPEAGNEGGPIMGGDGGPSQGRLGDDSGKDKPDSGW